MACGWHVLKTIKGKARHQRLDVEAIGRTIMCKGKRKGRELAAVQFDVSVEKMARF